MSLRTLVVLPCYLILTIGLSLFALGTVFFDRSGKSIHRVAVFWAKMVQIVSGVRTQLFNSDVLAPNQSYIFAANHRSAYDIPALLSTLPIPFRWLAKEGYFKIPLFGWAMKRAGYISINRSNPKQAYQSIQQAAQKVNEGTSVIIFPEGTRQKTDQLGEFNKGIFILAMKSQKPIVPVAIQGSGRVLSKGSFWITPGTITIVLGNPIPTECYCKKKEADILMNKVRESIQENLSKRYPESRSQESE
jgi:1-acyl-sn-glycerol-3-phosphate acyltransferase